MKAATESRWAEANQRYLAAEMSRACVSVARVSGKAVPGALEAAEGELREAAAGLSSPSALQKLCDAFHLSSFERDILLCCAALELVGTFAAECAAAQGDPRRDFFTFGLAMAALPAPHWSAIAPEAPLRRWSLVEVAEGGALTTSPLRIDEPVLHYLTGLPFLDPLLEVISLPAPAVDELAPSQRAVAERILQAWAGAEAPAQRVIQLCSPDLEARQTVAAHSCARLGLGLRILDATQAPMAARDQERLARLCERSAVLAGQAMLLECGDSASPDTLRAAMSLVRRLHATVLVTSREPLPIEGMPGLRLELAPPLLPERRALWMRALGPHAKVLDGALDRIADQFKLGARSIHAASAEALARWEATGGALEDALWAACRSHLSPRLDELAQRLEPSAGWDDLVLPEEARRTLGEIAASVRQSARVRGAWGFGTRGARGLGNSVLFAGPSGTGKTLAAEVLARELRLDLFRIDLSQVISKYIGETEKNLQRVFNAAEEGGAILLFDEADALFGKRSEVKDSHDRYANIEVSYLLQRMEAYDGLAILTTNLKSALDPAFLRRLRFVVQFPFPDVVDREEIWRRAFPPSTPTEALDPARLARLSLSGGNIRTVALNAACLAAEMGGPVRMEHVFSAARTELAKLEKPLPAVESGGEA